MPSSATHPGRSPKNCHLHSLSAWRLAHAHLLIACDGEDESHRRRIFHPWALIFSGKSPHLWALIFSGRKQVFLF
tara:strand:- start:571 stop:795 length:225 start_codon:yes stop_codon:yes gene_type:complete